ncbi:hypothetical protein [Spirosoma sp. 48-14]|uniref:hypothetical protein n=1 Tax=Spirosoma sp. 48-14 TaxID=1895854 RepID=UPI00095FFA4A|nr:hypothetical protein [Spirosoma sp. 48-14]OJW76326.1 MAG: hypothetical protein BGO59_22670 [Spirosoma sp. 48-14]
MEPTTKPKKVHYRDIKKKLTELGPDAMIHYNNDLDSLANFQRLCMFTFRHWEFPVTDVYIHDKATHQNHSFA